MHRRLLILTTTVILLCSFTLAGCNYKSKKALNFTSETLNTKAVKLTIEEIKKKYIDTKVKNIQNIGENFILVESQKDTFANKFDIYNLRTGEMDTLPTSPDFVTLEKVVNENYFIFQASGKNSESPFGSFPFLISCIRINSDINKDDDFLRLQDDKYYNLDCQVQSGSKEGTVLSNLNVFFDGFEVLFEPSKGDELQFYADATDIPPTKTSYNKENRQLVFEIKTNKLSDKLKKKSKVTIDDNQYISSYEIIQKDNKAYLTVTVSDLVKTYMVKTKRLPNQLPYFTVVFTGE